MRGAFAMVGEREISGLCASMEALAGDVAAFAREFERDRHSANDIPVRRASSEAKQPTALLAGAPAANR